MNKKYQIILFLLSLIIIDKNYVQATWDSMEQWNYVVQDEKGNREVVRDYDGTFLIGDKVVRHEKQQGLMVYNGIIRE